MYPGMVEAMRLTREGRLAEATALIQRTLGLVHAPPEAATEVRSAPEPIQATLRVVAERKAEAEAISLERSDTKARPKWPGTSSAGTSAGGPEAKGDAMYTGMIEAARLTREGRLAEAAALFQRTLGLTHVPLVAPSEVKSARSRSRRRSESSPNGRRRGLWRRRR